MCVLQARWVRREILVLVEWKVHVVIRVRKATTADVVVPVLLVLTVLTVRQEVRVPPVLLDHVAHTDGEGSQVQLAHRDRWDHQGPEAHLERTASQELQERPELPDCQERSVCVDLEEVPVRAAILATQAHQVPVVLWVIRDHQVVPARQEVEVLMENKALKAIQARTASQVCQDQLVRKEKKESAEVRVFVGWRDSPARKDRKESAVDMEYLAQKEIQGQRVLLGRRDLRVQNMVVDMVIKHRITVLKKKNHLTPSHNF